MLCQSCGRRSPDSKSFCGHCGAVASPDVVSSLPHPSIPYTFRQGAPKPRASRPAASRPAENRRSASGFSTLVFWAIVAGSVYWALGDDRQAIITSLLYQLEGWVGGLLPPAARYRTDALETSR